MWEGVWEVTCKLNSFATVLRITSTAHLLVKNILKTKTYVYTTDKSSML